MSSHPWSRNYAPAVHANLGRNTRSSRPPMGSVLLGRTLCARCRCCPAHIDSRNGEQLTLCLWCEDGIACPKVKRESALKPAEPRPAPAASFAATQTKRPGETSGEVEHRVARKTPSPLPGKIRRGAAGSHPTRPAATSECITRSSPSKEKAHDLRDSVWRNGFTHTRSLADQSEFTSAGCPRSRQEEKSEPGIIRRLENQQREGNRTVRGGIASNPSPPAVLAVREPAPARTAHNPTRAGKTVPTERKSEVGGVQPPKVYGKRGPGSSLTGVSFATRDKSPSDFCGAAVGVNQESCGTVEGHGSAATVLAAGHHTRQHSRCSELASSSGYQAPPAGMKSRNPKPKTIKRNPRNPLRQWRGKTVPVWNTKSIAEVDAEARS